MRPFSGGPICLLNVSLKPAAAICSYSLTSIDLREEHGSVHQLQRFRTMAMGQFEAVQAAQCHFQL